MIWLGLYLFFAILTFRRVLYLNYSQNRGSRWDAEDWVWFCFCSAGAALVGFIAYPALVIWSVIKTLDGRGIKVPLSIIMSVPLHERQAMKRQKQRELQEMKKHELKQREERIRQREIDLGFTPLEKVG